MIIKAQNEKLYDIYTVSTKENKVCCQDNADRRRKVILENTKMTAEHMKYLMK